MSHPESAHPHVLVVGGGFAGLNAVRTLRKADVRITLLDRENYHLFQPLLYQVATAALNPSDISAPLRSVFSRQMNVTVALGEVHGIDVDARTVRSTAGSIQYDFLILAAGATHSYFGHQDWERHAPGLKTIEDALFIRKRVLLAYEAAELETDESLAREWLTFVVVGGGPTGVELAGALSEIGRHTLAEDFRRIDPRSVRVMLVEGEDRILGTYPAHLSTKARKQLERLGVEVRTGEFASDITHASIRVGEDTFRSRTILWAAGVQASPLARQLGVPLDEAGRVIVGPDLSVPGRPEVFVAGDLARMEFDDRLVPGVAPAAIQSGRHAARSILRRIDGRPTEPFHYVDKGSLATIGRAAAVGEVRGWTFSGWTAWMLWLFVHLLYLIGFRNRFLVLTGWAWSYITFDRGARLITGDKSFAHPSSGDSEEALPRQIDT